MTRNEAREILMQILFELDASKAIQDGTAGDVAAGMAEERLEESHIERGKKLIGDILDNLKDIDDTINSHSSKWKTTRMPKVDLAIMRLALGEIRFDDDIPDAVAINEAINIAKKYSTENSSRFIHGVLGSALKDTE